MPDTDIGDEYFVPTTSACQCQVIERVDPSRYMASTSDSYAEPIADEDDAGEVPEYTGETPENVVEASIFGAPIDLMLLTGYPTHVALI